MPNTSPLFKRTAESFSFPDDTLTIFHPAKEINELVESLTPLGEMVELQKGQRLSMAHKGEQVCYLLINGYFSFRYYRQGTVITNVYPPIIAGIAEIFGSKNAGYFRAETTAHAVRVSSPTLLKCLNDNPDLWINVARVLGYIIQRLFLRDQQINTKNAYLVVCNLLQDLNNQPAEIKGLTPAAHYIIDRTALSRSTVLHILSKLQHGKYIEMKRGGYLTAIHHLPEQLL